MSAQVEEEEVEESAEALELMFEEAVIKDESGEPIGMDYDKIQEELDVTDDEIEDMKAEIEESEESSTACDCEVSKNLTMGFQTASTDTPYGPAGNEAVRSV
ncbi:hypothetical protein [Alteribacillus bidgolensis]|uniref:Uncharacterized protein n=1 Tax=Alteribacillus bidgolensis TaxID=930129 RepID=A0A1G8ELY4_9BACI|nr:hypothetical protein [Alteribacillus bidgolensis]SDH70792.1 hypothetical protein SAMN05216352_102282 [Alteribacillus bidgolensis]